MQTLTYTPTYMPHSGCLCEMKGLTREKRRHEPRALSQIREVRIWREGRVEAAKREKNYGLSLRENESETQRQSEREREKTEKKRRERRGKRKKKNGRHNNNKGSRSDEGYE